MTIEYTWKITSLKIKDISDNKPKAVVQTYWQKIGTDENGNTGIFSGATPFTIDSNDEDGPFIPFENLTEEDVLSWIKTIVVGSYEEHVNGKIAEQIADKIAPVTEAKMPWATDESPTPNVPVTP